MKRAYGLVFSIIAAALAGSIAASAQTPDSVWVRMVNDSALVIRPVVAAPVVMEPEPVADTTSIQPAVTREQIRISLLDSLLTAAQDWQDGYCYEKAALCYMQADTLAADEETETMIMENLNSCRYAMDNTLKVPKLSVVARQKFSIDDFFLYYPLPDGSWHEVEGAPAVYHPGTEDEIYVSRDAQLDMVYPMTCGNTMYFSSRTLNGFGGYDLYSCEWDSRLGEWGEPKNMGFPYSSAGDDFLFIQTEDGRYSIFASNRDAEEGSDSVYVYVVARTKTQKFVNDPTPEDLSRMAELQPEDGVKYMDNAGTTNAAAAELSARYKEQADKERALRAKLETVDSEELPAIQAELESVASEKKRIEAQMLETSSVRERLNAGTEQKIVGLDGAYIFTRKSLGKPIKVNYTEN